MRGAAKFVLLGAGIVIVLLIALVGFVISSLTGTRAKQQPSTDVSVVSGTNQEEGAELHLGQATAIAGTTAIRIDLYYLGGSGHTGFSSSRGSYEHTRNILFVERGEKAARWLLQDNNHLVLNVSDINENKDKENRVLASVAFVKPAEGENAPGKLLLFDPAGKNVVTIADDVTRIDFSTYAAGEVFVLYERDRKLMQAAYDPRTLAKLRNLEIDVPKISPPHIKKD